MTRTRTAAALCAMVLFACGSDEQGEVVVSAYGEEFIELGISSDDIEDDWTVSFSSFAVSVDTVNVAGESIVDLGEVELASETNGSGHELAWVRVDVGEYDGPGYTLSGIRVIGSATLADDSKTFDWQFPTTVRYENCDTRTAVSADAAARFEITVHSDHLLYDSLVAEEPSLFFGPLAAADGDRDGVISESELAATDIGAYDPGNSGATDLWTYLQALVGNLGHVDGEGHCDAR